MIRFNKIVYLKINNKFVKTASLASVEIIKLISINKIINNFFIFI